MTAGYYQSNSKNLYVHCQMVLKKFSIEDQSSLVKYRSTSTLKFFSKYFARDRFFSGIWSNLNSKTLHEEKAGILTLIFRICLSFHFYDPTDLWFSTFCCYFANKICMIKKRIPQHWNENLPILSKLKRNKIICGNSHCFLRTFLTFGIIHLICTRIKGYEMLLFRKNLRTY